MKLTKFTPVLRRATVIGGAILLVGSVGFAHKKEELHSDGTYEKGEMVVPLYRGAAIPDEVLVIPTPDNCNGNLRVELKWDEKRNLVELHLVGKKALQPYPTVHRTEGVDYFPNPFWPEPKDIVNGRYLLWVIMPAHTLKFYYDPTTLDLLGSEFEIPNPPPDAITLDFPTFHGVPTAFFQPKPNGDVDFTQRFRYDALINGHRPDLSHTFGTYIPQNLCKAHPTRYDLTSTRPYAPTTRPASEAVSFADHLRAGLLFDLTVEPASYYSEPPVPANISAWSNGILNGGGVPKGWTADLEAAFSNNAPAIREWEGANSCTGWFKPVRNRSFDACAGP